jgi:hypothetical protein
VVGEEDVKYCNKIKQLRQGEGIYDPLKHKGYFERHPHRGRRSLPAQSSRSQQSRLGWFSLPIRPAIALTPSSSIPDLDGRLKMASTDLNFQ